MNGSARRVVLGRAQSRFECCAPSTANYLTGGAVTDVPKMCECHRSQPAKREGGEAELHTQVHDAGDASHRVQPVNTAGYCRFDVELTYANGDRQMIWDVNLCDRSQMVTRGEDRIIVV